MICLVSVYNSACLCLSLFTSRNLYLICFVKNQTLPCRATYFAKKNYFLCLHLSLSIYRIVSCWGPAWLCLCVCVGMRVCVHRCVCVCLFASMCAWISVCVSASICLCVFLCLCASLCVCVCLSWLQGVKSSDKSWRAVCDTIWRQARQLFDGSFLFAQDRDQWLFNILKYTFNFLKSTFKNKCIISSWPHVNSTGYPKKMYK